MQKELLKANKLSSDITHSRVSIRPFVSGKANMGLEQYNLVVADGIHHTDGIICTGEGAVKTYRTGLNESAPELVELKSKAETDKNAAEQYRAKITEIRRIVARAERELAGNYKVDPSDKKIADDADFWNRVTTFKSVIKDEFNERNERIPTYWDQVLLKLDNNGEAFKESDIKDLLIIKAIEAGGFALVARSYQEAIDSNKYKFYLDKKENSSTTQVSGKILRDKAGTELIKMYEGDPNKLFYITKLVSIDSLYYRTGRNGTPLASLYDDCSRFLDGEGTEKNKTNAAQKFLSYSEMSMEDIKLRCYIKDGTMQRYLAYKPDGSIYYIKTSTPMGKTTEDCLVFLKDPLNQDIYIQLKDELEKDYNS